MKLGYGLSKPLAKVILASPIALGLWWILLQPVFLTVIEILAGTLLEFWFGYLDADVVTRLDMNWYITTNLLYEPEPYTALLQANMSFIHLSLGLPLLWCLCCGFLNKSKILKLLLGSGILLLLICIAIVLKGVYLLYYSMAQDNVLNQYLAEAQLVIPIESISTFKLNLWLMMGNVVNYVVVFVFPLAWCYWSNKDLIREMIES